MVISASGGARIQIAVPRFVYLCGLNLVENKDGLQLEAGTGIDAG